MRILDIIKKRLSPGPRSLTLQPDCREEWSQQLSVFVGLDKEYAAFAAMMKDLSQRIDATLVSFTDDGLLSAIPERARTMNALHGNEYASQVRKLLATAHFSELFDFEKQQEIYFEANATFKDQTAKNVSALKEFMHDELKTTQTLLQSLEDTVINFTKIADDHKFPQIRKMRDLHKRDSDLQGRGDKYASLLASIEQDLLRTREKKKKLEDEMHAQTGLIRNDPARLALEKLAKLEQEMHRTIQQYIAVCDDVKAVLKKYPSFRLDAKTRRVFDELPKDAQSFIVQDPESIKAAFEQAVSSLEEESPGNVRRIIERLAKLAKSAEQDSRMINTTMPDLRTLKRDVLRDIAAVNVYDKQQFHVRATTEEEMMAGKIEYIKQELDPNRRNALQQEMRAIAKELGATIADEPVIAEGIEKIGVKNKDGDEPDDIQDTAESLADIEPEHEPVDHKGSINGK